MPKGSDYPALKSWYTYDKFRIAQQSMQLDFETMALHLAVVTSAYTPDQKQHDFFNDITDEVVGTGYTAGGVPIMNAIIAIKFGQIKTFRADTIRWYMDPEGFTNGRRFILYDRTGKREVFWRLLAYSDDQAEDFGNVLFDLIFAMSDWPRRMYPYPQAYVTDSAND